MDELSCEWYGQMKIVRLRDFDASLRLQDALLVHSSFGSTFSHAYPEGKDERDGYPISSDYGGLAMIEDGRLLSRISVCRLELSSPHGVIRCCGIGGVGTRPGSGRRGLARSLLREVHRVERAAGSRYSLLYTSRSIVAHGLYESMGYHDILDFPRAVRRVPTDHHYECGDDFEWGVATPPDYPHLRIIHSVSTHGWSGFTPRPPGWTPQHGDVFLLKERGKPSGYAVIERQGTSTACWEALATDASSSIELLRRVEAEGRGQWLIIGGGPFRMWSDLLQGPEWISEETSWGVLMACSLQENKSREELVASLGAGDVRRFACFALDTF